MISFFRRIRQKLLTQNRITRYLVYALGEILLVVIGILIALQVNNWNEVRKAKDAQEIMLISFSEDLKSDAAAIKLHLENLENILEVHQKMYEIRKGDLNLSDLNNPGLIRGSIRYGSIVVMNNPDFGSKLLIPSIKKQVLDYYQSLSRAENSYEQYDQVVKDLVRPYLREQNLMNEDFFFMEKNPEKGIILPMNIDKLNDAINRTDFGQILLEANLKAHELVANLKRILGENEKLQQLIAEQVN